MYNMHRNNFESYSFQNGHDWKDMGRVWETSQCLHPNMGNFHYYYYSFFFSLPILCRRFLGDGLIDQFQIFRDYEFVSEVYTARSIFGKSLPVRSYCPFIKIQSTSLSGRELKNGLSQSTEIFSDDRGHVAIVHLSFEIFRKCLVWKLGRGRNLGHES